MAASKPGIGSLVHGKFDVVHWSWKILMSVLASPVGSEKPYYRDEQLLVPVMGILAI